VPKNTSDSSSLLAAGGGAATSSGVLFQQHVGALIASWMLAEAALDPQFELGQARPLWLRFETEAPVDDILVATSDGGFLAFQVKTTLSSSQGSTSPFAKTADQLVRHWLVCRDGSGNLDWNRPLDARFDRLVIAVSPTASATVRLLLPAALRILSQPGKAAMTQDQGKALANFEACVRASWKRATSEPFVDAILSDLSRIVSVITVNPDSRAILSTVTALVPGADAQATADALEKYCGDQMSQRGGFDVSDLRRGLMTRGARLASAPAYRADIERLKAHSTAVRQSLGRYEVIYSGDNGPIGIQRDCQPQVDAAARSESLLVVGEPGAGKSGVLNALARTLAEQGHDVIELAVDQFSIETLQGLSDELQLEHPLLEVIAAWDGAEPAWLIVDALDATRGGKGEGAFRTLIERVIALRGRWRVVASIRTFDLRMGLKFRELFKGIPPFNELSEAEFATVRHVRIPAWTPSEFDRLLDQAPALAELLSQGTSRLRDLASVPFNTRLLGELLDDQIISSDLSRVVYQSQLLSVYWNHRVTKHGYEAEACLRRVVSLMVKAGALRASRMDILDAFPKGLETLVQEGVLISTESHRWIQFRHHLLFDYAASRVYLGPALLAADFAGLGLMLAPALSFVLQELWASDDSHAEFWRVISKLVADEQVDPVARSAASRLPAELAISAEDADVLAAMIETSDEHAVAAIPHVVGALAVRLDDGDAVQTAPWVRLAGRLAGSVAKVAWPLRLLCHLLIARASAAEDQRDLGAAARSLLTYAFESKPEGYLTEAAIGFVADTYATDPEGSQALLAQIFDDEKFQAGGWNSVPALARKIDVIAPHDPEFSAYVYREVYARSIREDRETSLGDSQILPLRSNAKQDYELARYGLSNYFPAFLIAQPVIATRALVAAVDAFVAREHPISANARLHSFEVGGRTVQLQEDYSYIWASDPDAKYAHDGDVLVSKFLTFLQEGAESDVLAAANTLVETGSLALYWARLFMAAASRQGALANWVWPYASCEAFLLATDTRKDAIDVLASGYENRPESERRAFEAAAEKFDFSDYDNPTEARELILSRVFGGVGKERLLTDFAKSLSEKRSEVEERSWNPRPFSIRTSSRTQERYFWLDDLDATLPANVELISAIDAAKQAMGLEHDSSAMANLGLTESVEIIERLLGTASAAIGAHSGLKQYAEGVAAQATAKLVAGSFEAAPSDGPDPAEALLMLIETASRSHSPAVDDDTEANFAESASWGSPAARVEAAHAVLNLLHERPHFYTRLAPTIWLLLADPHPAVRLQSVARLSSVGVVDRLEFWSQLQQRVSLETNATVLVQGVCEVLAHVMNTDPERVEMLALELHRHFRGTSKSDLRIRKSVATILAHLWVGYGRLGAKAVIDQWREDLITHRKEMSAVITDLRQIYVYGLYGEPQMNAASIRVRALDLLHASMVSLHAFILPHFDRATPTEDQREDAGRSLRLVDTVCMQLYFAIDSLGVEGEKSGALNVLFDEIRETLKLIGDVGAPHTIYYLVQLLEKFISTDPPVAFDLLANAILVGGQRLGIQYEFMGADLLVRLVGVYLADHKEVFEDQDRRRALIGCLEAFMKAGWPSARRLLYRLPDLVQ